MTRYAPTVLVSGLLVAISVVAMDPPAKPEDAAIARTRKQIKMLDDLYKTTIVLITETYVHKEEDVAAATAAKQIFDAMRAKKHHDVRLVDATGNPYNEDNSPKDNFEKHAIQVLKEGKESYVERVEELDGTRYLRAATAVPVVLKKCALCHPHYKDAKPGQAIGALAYKLKIE